MGRMEWFAHLRRIWNTSIDEEKYTDKAPLQIFL